MFAAASNFDRVRVLSFIGVIKEEEGHWLISVKDDARFFFLLKEKCLVNFE